jgi:hypothetical protein
MRSFAERANLLAAPSGFWNRELLGAKPIEVCPFARPFARGQRILDGYGQSGSHFKPALDLCRFATLRSGLRQQGRKNEPSDSARLRE